MAKSTGAGRAFESLPRDHGRCVHAAFCADPSAPGARRPVHRRPRRPDALLRDHRAGAGKGRRSAGTGAAGAAGAYHLRHPAVPRGPAGGRPEPHPQAATAVPGTAGGSRRGTGAAVGPVLPRPVAAPAAPGADAAAPVAAGPRAHPAARTGPLRAGPAVVAAQSRRGPRPGQDAQGGGHHRKFPAGALCARLLVDHRRPHRWPEEPRHRPRVLRQAPVRAHRPADAAPHGGLAHRGRAGDARCAVLRRHRPARQRTAGAGARHLPAEEPLTHRPAGDGPCAAATAAAHGA